jgi:hypothetical protein
MNRFSDHYTLLLTIKLDKPQTPTNNIKSYLDYSKLVKNSARVDWSIVLSYEDANSATVKIIEMIKTIITDSTKTKANNKKNMPRKHWVTNGITKSGATKEKLYTILPGKKTI